MSAMVYRGPQVIISLSPPRRSASPKHHMSTRQSTSPPITTHIPLSRIRGQIRPRIPLPQDMCPPNSRIAPHFQPLQPFEGFERFKCIPRSMTSDRYGGGERLFNCRGGRWREWDGGHDEGEFTDGQSAVVDESVVYEWFAVRMR